MNDVEVLRFSSTGDPPVLMMAGEIDEDTYPVLVRKLAELGAGDIHLSLAGVEFCDLAGLRAIVRLAGPGRGEAARRVVLHEVPAQLQTVLGIVGWDSTPGLVIDNRPAGR